MAPRQITAFARANAARLRQPDIGLRLQSQRHAKRQRIDDASNDEIGPDLQLADTYDSIVDDDAISQSANDDMENDDDDEMPQLLQTVADSENNAISVTNNLLEAIEHALPNDPLLAALEIDKNNTTIDDALDETAMDNDTASVQSFELPQEDDFDEFDNVDELAGDVDEVAGHVNELAGDVDEVAENVDEVARDVDELSGNVDELAGTSSTPVPTFMLPPSRRPSVVDLSDEVPHNRAKRPLNTFIMAMGMWCETSGLSRQHYQGLLEVLELLDDVSTLKGLPRTVSTLKGWVQSQLPLMKLRRQEIDVVQEQLPTQGKTKQANTMYFFDPVHLFKTVLSSTLRSKLHTGMAVFVDEPSELYHSLAWASSIKACSGDYVYYPNDRQKSPIFPSDVVYYHCQKVDCFCQEKRKFHTARITAIGRDRTRNANAQNDFKLLANPLYVAAAFGLDTSDFPAMPANSTARELFLSDETLHLSLQQIHAREADIHFDYRYEGQSTNQAYTTRFVVRNVWDSKTSSTRPLMLSAPIRGALELSTYGREFLTNFATSTSACLSVPLLTFIDAFGLYRNMYRSLTGIYVTMAGLDWRERKRRANVLPLALGPHASDFADVIRILEPGLAALDRGIHVDINGVDTLLCVFTMAFTGDMKQQNDSSAMMSPIANRGCSKCLVTKKQKADLTFNVVLNARYHHRVLYERIKGDSLLDSAKFFQGMGMKAQQTPLVSIAPALDIIRSRPGDAAHSEFAGIAKQAQYVLFEAILTEAGADAYCAELRGFPFPSGWGRLQSPKTHLSSYRMQECGRLSIICPLLLRTWLQPGHINQLYLRAMDVTVSPVLDLKPIDAIVFCYAMIAKCNTVLLSQNLSNREGVTEVLLQSRKAFQRLFECAAIAASSSFKKGEMPISSRGTSRDITPDDNTFEESSLQYLGRSEYDNLAEMYEVDGSKKVSAFRNFLSRPNVHTALHYDDVIAEYATANNCTTFSGEDKHRFFKKAVTQTNFRDVEKVLLTKESIHQTLRFLLAGSFTQSEPELTQQVTAIHIQCPTLLNDLLLYSETGEDAADDDGNSPQSSMLALGDAAHTKPLAIACLDRSYVVNVLQWPVRPGLDSNDFSHQLQAAYDIDYHEPNVVLPRKAGIQWCQKLSFHDRASQHRVAFKIGEFVTVRGAYFGRMDGAFLHQLSPGKTRLFVRITRVQGFESGEKHDPVIKAPLLKLGKTAAMEIIGLPGIGAKKHFILPVRRQEREDGSKRGLVRGGNGLLLYWNHEIQFM